MAALKVPRRYTPEYKPYTRFVEGSASLEK
jgi:hypothetical protein